MNDIIGYCKPEHVQQLRWILSKWNVSSEFHQCFTVRQIVINRQDYICVAELVEMRQAIKEFHVKQDKVSTSPL